MSVAEESEQVGGHHGELAGVDGDVGTGGHQGTW